MGLVTKAIICLTLGVAMTGAETRYAVRYNPGLMEQVSRNRGMPVVACMVAHPTIDLGAWLLVEGPTGARLRCRVTDVSAPADKARHIRLRRIEVDYESGAILCGRRWKGKASECPVKVKAI